MVVKRKFIPGSMGNLPSARRSQAKRLKTLERKVASNQTEVRIDSNISDADLRSPGGGSGLNGFLNNPTNFEVDGRNFKTVSIKARLNMDTNLLSIDDYRYRMILFSNKNDSGRDNTQVQTGEFPGPYDGALSGGTAHLNFFIDEKKFTVYDDKMQSPRSQMLSGTPQNQLGYGGLEVRQIFKTNKLVRYPSSNPTNPTSGCIGLAIWRQSLTSGAVERVTAASVDAPLILSEHKWIDP